MFKHIAGNPKVEWYNRAASQAFTNGGLAYWNGSGYLIPADATSGDHAGIIMKDVLSTDADYATAAEVPVAFVGPDDILEADIATGTLTVAMVGNFYDLNSAGTGVDVTATSKQVVQIVGFISTTKAYVKLNANAVYKRVATT